MRLLMACLWTIAALALPGCQSKGASLTAIITVSPQTLLPGGHAMADIVFSHPVTGFTQADVVVAGGSSGALTVIGADHYQMELTADGPGTTVMTATVPAFCCKSSSGRPLYKAANAQASIAYAQWGTPASDSRGAYADLAVTFPYGTATQRFRLVPAGTFTMGSPPDEAGREPQEFGSESLHAVTITTPFWLADSECTQRLWSAVTNGNPSYFTASGLDAPVEQVTYGDVTAFLAALNADVLDLGARLPTEAEWEYAARAGTTTPFAIAPVDATTVRCWADSGDPYVSTGVNGGTATVKLRPANAWGLYDMHGNVWEWCSDLYQTDLGTAPVTDPTGASTGTDRVHRGGSWGDYGRYSRSADRRRAPPGTTTGGAGFRIALPNGPSGSG